VKFNKYTISKIGFWKKSFEVRQREKVLYRISSEDWFRYKNFSVYDFQKNEVLLIKGPHEFPDYHCYFMENGKSSGVLTKSGMSKYTLESKYATYVADGNWLGNEFTIYLGDDDIAKVSRKFFSDHQQYGIAIIEGNHDLFILGMIVCIEIQRMTAKNS